MPAEPPGSLFREAILLRAVPDRDPGDDDVEGPAATRALELPRASRGITGPVLRAVRIREDAGAAAGPDEHITARIHDDHAAVDHHGPRIRTLDPAGHVRGDPPEGGCLPLPELAQLAGLGVHGVRARAAVPELAQRGRPMRDGSDNGGGGGGGNAEDEDCDNRTESSHAANLFPRPGAVQGRILTGCWAGPPACRELCLSS